MNLFPAQGRIGLMVLPMVTLFPESLLPLYIFEPRYREMLAGSLADSRLFGIAHATDETSCDPIGTIGIVRACVANPDGSSNLILHGVNRVKLSNFVPNPYPSADYEVIPESEALAEEFEALHLRILSLSVKKLSKLNQSPDTLEGYLVVQTNAAAFTDVAAANFVSDPVRRREIFLEFDIERRMSLLRDFMEEDA